MLDSVDDIQLKDTFVGAQMPLTATTQCPNADEFWLVCSTELDLQRRLEIVDHCNTCALCSHAMHMTRQMTRGLDEELTLIRAKVSDMPVLPVKAPQITLVETGSPSGALNSDQLKSPRSSQAADGQTVEKLSAWREKFKPLGFGLTGVAVAAVVTVLIVGGRNDGLGIEEDVRRGRDGVSVPSTGKFEYADRRFSWPSQADAEYYELEIKSAGSKTKCRRESSIHSLVVSVADCPMLSLTQHFFWRVRAISKEGPGLFSSYQSVPGSVPASHRK